MMRTHSRMLSHLSQEQEDKDVYSAEGKGAQGAEEPSTTAATEEQQEDEAGRFLTETAMSLDMSKLNRAETSRALGGGGTPRERLAAEQEKRKQANLAAASFPLIVMTGVVEALRDLKVTLGMILNIFGREALSDLGYESLTLSIQMEADWKPDTGALAIDRLTLSGENAGTLNAALRINGLTREVLEQLDAAQDNPEQAMGLMQGLLVESVSLRIENDSIVDRVLENQAKEAGATREVFVEQLTGALPFMLSMLNNAEFQAKIAGAATAFLKDPKSLSASAMPAAPVPFAQILGTAMMAPQSLPDILGVTITANQD